MAEKGFEKILVKTEHSIIINALKIQKIEIASSFFVSRTTKNIPPKRDCNRNDNFRAGLKMRIGELLLCENTNWEEFERMLRKYYEIK